MRNLLRKWLGIGNLEERIDSKGREIWELSKRLNKIEVSIPQEGSTVSENSHFYRIYTQLKAVIEYLKIEIKWDWEDDPSVARVEQPRIRVWKAYRIKKK